jgi:hypothetical protein
MMVVAMMIPNSSSSEQLAFSLFALCSRYSQSGSCGLLEYFGNTFPCSGTALEVFCSTNLALDSLALIYRVVQECQKRRI